MTWFTQYGKAMDEFIQHVESQTPTPSEFNLGFCIKIALAMNPMSLSIPAIYCTSYLRKTVTTVKDLFPALLVQFTITSTVMLE